MARQNYYLAVGDYEKAIELRKLFPKAHRNLARVYMKLDEYEKALLYFTHAINYQPINCREYMSCKYVLVDKELSLYSVEDYGEVFLERGIVYQKTGDAEKAFKDFNEALKWSGNLKVKYAARNRITSLK